MVINNHVNKKSVIHKPREQWEKCLLILSFFVAYFIGSYMFWLLYLPVCLFIDYKEMIYWHPFVAVSYGVLLVFSPITVPFILFLITFIYPFFGASISDIFFCWALAALSYVPSFLLMRVFIKRVIADLKK
jgi:hypothetical protein